MRARPNKDDYPSYEICKFFQEDKIDEMYEALGLRNQWPRLEKDPKVDFQIVFSMILLGGLTFLSSHSKIIVSMRTRVR